MLIAAISALLFTNPDGAVTAMITGSHAAVELAINLVALYGFWLGFFAILEKLNISAFISRLLRPLIRFLFKDLDEETEKYITMNMSANLLGLGNAATPMGINAINRLAKGKSYATTNMIMLIVISATSLQLLPSTVIGLRATHGSASPASFLPASIIATVLSTVIGVLLVKLLSRLFPDPSPEQLRRRESEAACKQAARESRRLNRQKAKNSIKQRQARQSTQTDYEKHFLSQRQPQRSEQTRARTLKTLVEKPDSEAVKR